MQNLTDIAIFVKVVELSSFTAAAEALDMSQPVVSKAVTRLEEKLGARLLNRTTRRLSLTEAGSELYGRSVRALAEIENARIWAGLHFRTADVQGMKLGQNVADHAAANYFQPVGRSH